MARELGGDVVDEVSCGLREVQKELQNVQQLSNAASSKLATVANSVLLKLDNAVEVKKESDEVKVRSTR